MNLEYISLKEATKFCKYSQDYLKLRSRQGKLRAVKIGRNWLTKKEWIEEYLKDNKNNKKTPPAQAAKAWWLGLIVLLLLVGSILNYSKTFKEYLQWCNSQMKFQTANLSENFGESWKIIPGRVIEIK